ncbi:prolyl oligopeptidase family serine peptidase [Gordonia sp. Z-3]|jgi:dipeptidyl aminopeptidase/acylaminoacyl peptidase|uniref:Alpha/beta fold hydrolase n=1 Tax=Gordonia tangerina TaxID=2911060 RepID=A0ABS9DNJ9_9ACTN|nr:MULTISPECIES: prolyl oligopeptidase family serine peptidase [Gordonia]MAU82273.1 S9 family peptidase [Gordonia sp. (in: high G+C Gram-positive bacteria)]MCF3940778.1 alpha/beta fold hydrolase [Gordonia tangerina]MED5799471.1 prolyl oligopeptidase family serine peptidase [Gordonia sp. Z-3]
MTAREPFASGPTIDPRATAPTSRVRFDDRGWHTYGASVSPDGSAFAYIVDDGDGYPRAAQRSLSTDGVGELRWVRLRANGPVRRVIHSTDSRWLAVEIAPSGGEHHQVWVVTTDAEDDTAYRVGATRPDGRSFGTVSLVGWDTDWVLITATEPDGTAHSLRVHPGTGTTMTLDVRVGGALIDSWKGATLVRVGPRGYRDIVLIRRRIDTVEDAIAMTPLLPNDPGSVTDQGYILDQGFDHPSLVFVGPPQDEQRDLDSVQALVVSDFDAKFPRLLGVEVADRGVRFRVLAQRPDVGVDEFAVSHDQSTVALLWNHAGRSELQILTLPDQTLHEPIRLPGEVAHELSISAAGKLVAVTVSSPQRSPLVHLINTISRDVVAVRDDVVAGDGPSAALRPELVQFSARDGMPLSGWLFRATPNDGSGPGPTLVYFHGGPEGQTRPEYNFLFGPLVDAGITVFAPNVRGSSGYGRLFSHADDRYGRYAGIDDAADCAEYLIDHGIADPDAVYCAGRSYGGYLTLACLTFHPDMFAAGIAICGMSDLESFFRNTEPWIAVAAYTKYGHPESDRELLADLSPIHRIDDVRAPLLVIHGAHDTNVPVSESQQMVDELRARGAVAELLLFNDEGHEIVKRHNQQILTEAVAGWIHAHPSRATGARR